MTIWNNDDGLRVKFGPAEAGPARVTEYTSDGPRRYTEIIVDADFLPAGGSIILDSYVFPVGAQIEGYSFPAPSEDFTDGTSVALALVDVGGGNAVTVTGAITTADLNDAGADDLDTTILTARKQVQLTTVGTFTAGKTTIRVYWSVPKEETDTLVWNKSA